MITICTHKREISRPPFLLADVKVGVYDPPTNSDVSVYPDGLCTNGHTGETNTFRKR